MRHDEGAALSAVIACESALRHGMAMVLRSPADERSLIHRFPVQAALVCRKALDRAQRQQHYFPHAYMHDEHSEITFAIRVLGELGEEADLSALRKISGDPALGTSAIAAIRKLEGRFVPSARS